MTPDLLILGALLGGLLLVLLLRDHGRRPGSKPALPPNSIVVDGSNVMHWGGDPSANVLKQVVRALEKKGFSPFVIFDASVGYRLGDRYLDDAPMSKMIGVPVDQVLVVAKGVIADEVILQFATEYGLRVVTNDRYRDWSVQYPIVKKRGSLVKGSWKEGAVVWRYPQDLKARADAELAKL